MAHLFAGNENSPVTRGKGPCSPPGHGILRIGPLRINGARPPPWYCKQSRTKLSETAVGPLKMDLPLADAKRDGGPTGFSAPGTFEANRGSFRPPSPNRSSPTQMPSTAPYVESATCLGGGGASESPSLSDRLKLNRGAQTRSREAAFSKVSPSPFHENNQKKTCHRSRNNINEPPRANKPYPNREILTPRHRKRGVVGPNGTAGPPRPRDGAVLASGRRVPALSFRGIPPAVFRIDSWPPRLGPCRPPENSYWLADRPRIAGGVPRGWLPEVGLGPRAGARLGGCPVPTLVARV